MRKPLLLLLSHLCYFPNVTPLCHINMAIPATTLTYALRFQLCIIDTERVSRLSRHFHPTWIGKSPLNIIRELDSTTAYTLCTNLGINDQSERAVRMLLTCSCQPPSKLLPHPRVCMGSALRPGSRLSCPVSSMHFLKLTIRPLPQLDHGCPIIDFGGNISSNWTDHPLGAASRHSQPKDQTLPKKNIGSATENFFRIDKGGMALL